MAGRTERRGGLRRRSGPDLSPRGAGRHSRPSSAPTRPATTAPENTAPWPTPAADPTASTPPRGFDLSCTYRCQTVSRVPGLDSLDCRVGGGAFGEWAPPVRPTDVVTGTQPGSPR
jgi:hypothetical protein